MATRRARVKLAPNLGLARNKSKAICPKPKIIVKSDTENSDADQIADIEEHARNVDSMEKQQFANGNAQSEKVTSPIVTVAEAATVENNTGTAEDENHAATDNVENLTKLQNNHGSNVEDSVLLTSPLPLKSSVVVTLPPSVSVISSSSPATVFDIVTNPVKELPNNLGNADEESDWEDDQFTYKSVEVNENDEMYKSLEITPLNGNSMELPAVDEGLVVETDHAQSSVQPTVTQPPITSNGHAPKVRLPLGKNKFKPNLNFDRRSRNISGGSRPTVTALPRTGLPHGSPLPRARTISGSSTSSEPEIPPPHPRQSLSPSPGLVRTGVSPIPAVSPKPARIKRTADIRAERSNFMRRKLDHKKKFMRGVPERGSMTMFDLIYYNPEYGQRMSVEDKDEDTVDNPDELGDDQQQEVPNITEELPGTEPVTPERAAVAMEESIPVPRVKVGPNGEIILDETSLHLETNDQKKAKEVLQKSPVVFETNRTSTNYGTWSKKRRHNDWSEKETIKFYKALSVVGSDFSMMETIFKNRSRNELKLKFKKEEQCNIKIIDKCLKEKGMFTDLNELMNDSEDEDEVEEKGRGRKIKKKRPRRRYKNRGYYSSSEGEDADVETSKSPARKKTRQDSQEEERQMVRIKRPQVMHRETVSNKTIRPINPRAEAISLSQLAEQAKANGGMTGISVSSSQVPTGLPGVQFPPGLLAANPVLGSAKPGSLVVVASPNKTDPSSQLLHVYMVSAKNKERLDRDRDRSGSPRTSGGVVVGPHRSVSPRMPLDPAVVRAVDRSRVERARTLSESGGKVVGGRVRTVSEDKTARTDVVRSRQRTCSESGLSVRNGDCRKDMDLRTETIKRRFLSGTARSCPDLPPPTPTASLPIARKSKPVEMLETQT